MENVRKSRPLTLLVAAIAALAMLLSGCSSSTQVGSETHPCSPNFTPSNSLGTISAQQRGVGYGIQWGVYPNTQADLYVVDVYINNKKVDHKNQNYPPHGSVNAKDVPRGAIFRLVGTATKGKDVAKFWLTCRAAG